MVKEVETKFKIRSPDVFKKSLKKLGARFISKKLEKDTYYHGPAGCPRIAIRFRTTGNKGIFTIKTATQGLSHRYKVRNELEVVVDDAKVFNKMLLRLGFSPDFKKEKIRETYKWKNAKISIDKIPFIGTYAEIEAPKKRIKEVARLLGLDMAMAIPDTYMQLFNYYKIIHRKPELKLIFKKNRALKV